MLYYVLLLLGLTAVYNLFSRNRRADRYELYSEARKNRIRILNQQGDL